jgi:hypothetical protein
MKGLEASAEGTSHNWASIHSPRYWSVASSLWTDSARLSWNFYISVRVTMSESDRTHNLQDVYIRKVPRRMLAFPQIVKNPEATDSCANHAVVTADNLSLSCPNRCGCDVTTTTAFCTVDLVTSGDLFFSLPAEICLVHDIPNSDVAGNVSVAFRRSVK